MVKIPKIDKIVLLLVVILVFCLSGERTLVRRSSIVSKHDLLLVEILQNNFTVIKNVQTLQLQHGIPKRASAAFAVIHFLVW